MSLPSAVLLFGQGLIYVGLQAANVAQIARHHYVGAFVVGYLISQLWAWNVKSIAKRSGWGGTVYAVGAAFGTVAGMWLAGLL